MLIQEQINSIFNIMFEPKVKHIITIEKKKRFKVLNQL